VNDIELTSADRTIAAFTALRAATSIELRVVRRGEPLTLNYQVR
jgi:type II secretory pathway component PulC